jgi:hypothetical protein
MVTELLRGIRQEVIQKGGNNMKTMSRPLANAMRTPHAAAGRGVVKTLLKAYRIGSMSHLPAFRSRRARGNAPLADRH